MKYQILDPNTRKEKDVVEVVDLQTCNQVFMYQILGWKVVKVDDKTKDETAGNHSCTGGKCVRDTQELAA